MILFYRCFPLPNSYRLISIAALAATSNRMRTDYPSFTQATERLREFLDRHRWPVEIRWLRPGTLLTRGPKLVLHPAAFQPTEEIRTSYWYAVPKQLGVLLAGLCRDADHSYCHLWAPSNQDEAEAFLMPDGLKLSLPTEPPEVHVTSGWGLRWNRWRAKEVPLGELMMQYP